MLSNLGDLTHTHTYDWGIPDLRCHLKSVDEGHAYVKELCIGVARAGVGRVRFEWHHECVVEGVEGSDMMLGGGGGGACGGLLRGAFGEETKRCVS